LELAEFSYFIRPKKILSGHFWPLLAMAEWDFSSAGPIPGIVNRFVWRFLWESEKTRFKSKTFESETLYDSPAKLVKLS
jgi:hypothetical protein